MQDLQPIELEIAIKGAEALKDSNELDKSLKDLDKSVENVRKKFDAQTQTLHQASQAQKQHTQASQQQTQAQEKLNKTLSQSGQQAQASAGKFNALSNSVNQITRELPAFTYSAQTGFMAIANNIPILTDAMARLRAENEQLRASGQKTTPVWKQLIGSFFSWGTALSVGITLLTVYGKEIGAFFKNLLSGNASISGTKANIEAINKGFESANFQKASKDILQLKAEFDSARKGIIDKDKALKDYNKTVGDVMGRVNSFAEAEKKLINQGDAYVKMMLYKAAALASLDEANAKIIEIEKRKIDLENSKQASDATSYGRTFINKQQNKGIKEANKELKELEKSSLNVYNNIMGKAKAIAEQFGFNMFGDDKDKSKRSEAVENEYKKLLEKIAELDKEYSNQTFDKNEAEVQALRDKFDKVRKLVEEFNNNPKNKLKIGLSDFNSLETKAVETLKYRQQTEQLKKQLTEQKALFAEYEQYKSKVTIEEADKRFAKELRGFSSYTHLLETLIKKTQENDPDSPERTERLRELQAQLLLAQQETTQRERSKFADLLEEYKGFNQKRLDLDSQYYDDVALLEQQRNEANADAVDEAIQVRKAKYEEDLSNLQASILQSSDFYQKLFSDLSQKGYKTLRDFAEYTTKVLNSAKTYNTTDGKTMVRIEFDQINEQGEVVKRVSNITVAEFERVKAKAEELNKILRNKNPFAGVVHSFKEVNEAVKRGDTDALPIALNNLTDSAHASVDVFQEWGENLSKIFGEGVSDATRNIAKLADGVVNVGKGIGKMYSGDYVGGITSLISGITSIYSATSEWEAKAREQKAKMIVADIEALKIIQKQKLALKENVQELSIFNDQLELRNRLIQEGHLAQDGIVNKFKYDLDLLREYQQTLDNEQKSNNDFYNKLINARWDSGKVSTGSTSYVRWGTVIGGSLEEQRAAMEDYYRRLMAAPKDARGDTRLVEEYRNILRQAESMEHYIEILNQRGWLKGEAQQFYDAWKKSGENIEEVTKKLSELKNEMRQIVMGENFDSFVNNFANALAQSQGNVAQFADFTEKKIKASLFNAFKYQYLREQLKPLYENMADLLNQGVDSLDGNQIDQLANQYNQIFQNSSKKLEQIGQKLGTNLYDQEATSTSQNSLKGAVKGITEEQADLLAGQFGGLRLTQLETNKINKQGFDNIYTQTSKMVGIQIEIEKNTRRTADNTDAMKESLKSIETSVKSNSNNLKGNGIKP